MLPSACLLYHSARDVSSFVSYPIWRLCCTARPPARAALAKGAYGFVRTREAFLPMVHCRRQCDESGVQCGVGLTGIEGMDMVGRIKARKAEQLVPGAITAHRARKLIDLTNVVKSYATAAGEFRALKGVNLQVQPGEFVAVVGKSGSGKSTLSNMITGIDRPTGGTVVVADTPIHTLDENQIARWRGRNVGVVFQFFQLLPTLTVLENIMLPMDFCHMYTLPERRRRAFHLLEQVEMAEQASKLPTALSGGQQQRVAIARALANDPPIVIADEPTGNLDSRTADAVFQLFRQLVSNGKTILMVTHDDELAHRVTRTVTIADGEIVADTAIR